jgi:hypothetical protein
MKLQQGQQWTCHDTTLRVVKLERMAVTYKAMADPVTGEGTHHRVTKKEFCRLIKGAVLMPPPAD